MIQRVQTIYLALGGVALLGLFPFDLVWSSTPAETFSWYTPLASFAIAIAAGAAIGSIFLYKNRKKQRSTVVIVQVLTVLAILIAFGGLYLAGSFQTLLSPMTTGTGIMLALPIVAYILFFLARRGIDKDIALIKSQDRLR